MAALQFVELRSEAEVTSKDEASADHVLRESVVDVSGERRGSQTAFDKLYTNQDSFDVGVGQARARLGVVIEVVQDALDAFNRDEMFDADNALMLLHAHMAELFAHRAIGDGFGLVIASVFHALRNAATEPPRRDRILCIKRIMQTLREGIFLTFDDANLLINDLEDLDMKPYPTNLVEIGHLADGED
ncbi:hypothetical protein [Reyranella sp. CPCC 100927]|uniref:hypothetical protein n=1 Tax=Reyranella sp. CPCC 100927 TaxID=2599616 RepID=UPI0011B5E020|nr:hypothetical protein [Reyranella sp. CPCC 100927]TWT13804.1 hypothetical protein FQU96_07805 [Reyranella sp. CPCC 100927]